MADTEDSREKKRARDRERMRAWRAANPEMNTVRHRAWRAAHPGLSTAISKAWHEANPAWSNYLHHKSHAKRRGIPFLLTFEEWWGIWQASGKWDQRGGRKGQYVMARHSDVGPYAVGNVRICTTGDNISEAHSGKVTSAETRKKQSEAAKIHGAWRDNPQPTDAVSGRFISRKTHGTSGL